ncbi:hypothetical protein Agub_g6370, partial [Astrephomene gubernaculifera]
MTMPSAPYYTARRMRMLQPQPHIRTNIHGAAPCRPMGHHQRPWPVPVIAASAAAASTLVLAEPPVKGSSGNNANGHASNSSHPRDKTGAANGNGRGSPPLNGSSTSNNRTSALASSPAVQVHVVVPRCTTVPGERLVLVGE